MQREVIEMPDKQTHRILYVLVAVLLVAVSVQSWFLYDTHRQVRALSEMQPPDAGLNMPDPFGGLTDPQQWDPFKEMQQLQDRIDRLFGESFGHINGSMPQAFSNSISAPEIDLKETNDAYTADINVPGVDEQSLSVTVDNGVLTVNGEVEQQVETHNGRSLHREHHVSRFSRSISLPGPVDAAAMSTHLDNGVLHVRIPKKERG